MGEPAIDVVVFGVMQHRTDTGATDFWADIAQPDARTDESVSVALPAADDGLVYALRKARRSQTRLRVPAQFFASTSDEQVTALREALREAVRA